MKSCCGCVAGIFKKWGTTQTLNVRQQLEAGIRYIDIRVCVKPGTVDFYFLHGLYGPTVRQCMVEINLFLDEHPKEIVFLDFNHFYNMNDISHKQLLHMLLEIFDNRLTRPSFDNDPKTQTLENIWRTSQRIYLFYHSNLVRPFTSFWSGAYIVAPWPNKNKSADLIRYLEDQYDGGKRASSGDMYVWYGILTARTSNIAYHLCGSLQHNLALDATEEFSNWLSNKKTGPQGINICATDFVDRFNFIKTVIDLNILYL